MIRMSRCSVMEFWRGTGEQRGAVCAKRLALSAMHDHARQNLKRRSLLFRERCPIAEGHLSQQREGVTRGDLPRTVDDYPQHVPLAPSRFDSANLIPISTPLRLGFRGIKWSRAYSVEGGWHERFRKASGSDCAADLAAQGVHGGPRAHRFPHTYYASPDNTICGGYFVLADGHCGCAGTNTDPRGFPDADSRNPLPRNTPAGMPLVSNRRGLCWRL